MLTIQCTEWKNKPVTHTIKPLEFTVDNLQKLYKQMTQFEVLFGREIKTTEDFLPYFMSYSHPSGDVQLNGLFWAIDDLDTGIFYMTDIYDKEATAHFSFFDKKLYGREPLVRGMIEWAFKHYGFQRINAQMPRYISKARDFIHKCGFRQEGVKRDAAFYKGKWFDVMHYGILRKEIFPEGEK